MMSTPKNDAAASGAGPPGLQCTSRLGLAEKHRQQLNQLNHKVVSASIGALITSLVTTPFEVVKTRMQTSSATANVSATSPIATAGSAQEFGSHATGMRRGGQKRVLASQRAPSAISTFLLLVRNDGIRVLWSGLAPSLAMAVPSTALYFIVYEDFKQRIEGYDNALIPYAPLIAGIAGRSLTVAAVAPLELVRTVAMYKGGMTVKPAPDSIPVDASGPGRPPSAASVAPKPSSSAWNLGIVSALKDEVAVGGVRSLWRGLSPTLWRDVPFSGIYWLSYERGKDAILRFLMDERGAPLLGRSSPSFEQTFVATFLSGMAAGSVAAAVTTPFDVIKTRRQVRYMQRTGLLPAVTTAPAPAVPPMSSASRGGLEAYQGPTWTLVRQLLREEGWAGLFAGVNARVAKVAPSCAIMISSYELGKRVLQLQQQERRREEAIRREAEEEEALYWARVDRDEAAVTPAEQ